MADIAYNNNPKWLLKLGVSNNGEVVSVGEREIQLDTAADTAIRPFLDINMTLAEEKVFSRNEIVTVEGIMAHIWHKSKKESPTAYIRLSSRIKEPRKHIPF